MCLFSKSNARCCSSYAHGAQQSEAQQKPSGVLVIHASGRCQSEIWLSFRNDETATLRSLRRLFLLGALACNDG